MARKKYLIDNDSSQELVFKWNGGWKETEIIWNNEKLATLSKKELLSGSEINLTDDKILELKLEKGIFTTLNSKINGKHIPNSHGDPKYQLKQIFYLLIFLGSMNILVGAVFMIAELKIAELPGIGTINIIIGFIQILLGFATSKAIMSALIAVIILMGADLILSARPAISSFLSSELLTLYLLIT